MIKENQFFIQKQQEMVDFLVKSKVLTPDKAIDIMSEVETAGRSADTIIIEKNIIDLEIFAKTKAEFLNIPYIDLTDKEISEDILNVLPIEVAENYKIICFDKVDNKLSIGMTDPHNFKAIEAINFFARKNNYQVVYYHLSNASFFNAFKLYKNLNKEISTALESKAAEEKSDEANKINSESNVEFEEIVKDAPVAKIVSVIIKHAVEAGASDIHIEPLAKDTRVRYRVDGLLKTSLVLPKEIHNSVISRIKVLANLKLDETRIPQDGRIRLTINGRDVDFRISVLPLLDAEKVEMRILDTSKGMMLLDQLGFVGVNFDLITDNIRKTNGIILVTGPTGSGKTTTLYSILNLLNKEGVNIVTLEDPIEYFIRGVNQSQIKPEIGFSFASGLRSILRQDPNVIMVGEIRDDETAELAIHSALTGHLVLSSLHTNSAVGAIPRLMDMKIEPFLLASVLNVVVAQRLARRICTYCKQEEKITDKMMAEIKKKISVIPEELIKKAVPNFDINNLILYKGAGCSHCSNLGYKSRICLSEVLDINDKIKDLIIDGHGNLKIDDVARNQAFLTMEQDGLIKVLQGTTTLEEIIRVIKD